MAAWLDLVSDTTGWSLVDTRRLEDIVQGMSHPKAQYPSVVYFAGNGNRVKALRALFPNNNVTRRGPSGLVRLHLSTSTANSENPVIFAESNPFSPSGLGESSWLRWTSGKHRRYPALRNKSQSLTEIQQQVITRTIFPWTHVLCIFVDNDSEMKAAQQLLDIPRGVLTVGARPIPDLMRVVMVFTGNSMSEDSEINKDVLDMPLSGDHRSSVTILDLRDRYELSPTAAFEPLRRLILDEMQISQTKRIRQGIFFSACHLNVLWSRTLKFQMESTYAVELDCLREARENQQVNPIMTECLREFLSQSANFVPIGDIHAFIASALLMDAYPPGMHVFQPEFVFNSLYRKYCREAWCAQKGADADQNCQAVLAHFTQLFTSLNPNRSSASIRSQTLAEFYHHWAGLHSTTVCYFCLCRSPEHMLPCRHAICDTCVVIFGTSGKSAEYNTYLSQCPICEDSFQLTIRQLPPTKRPVILSLDGGGVRGIIQLGLLRALENRLGEISISQTFDLCVGTSVGALSAIDLMLNGTSAELCFRKFPDLARRVFQPSLTSKRKLSTSSCITWLRYFAGFLADGQYSSHNLESTLKEAMDPKRRVFDVATTKSSGCRVAIITSRTSDGKACVLANYRGVGRENTKAAYEFLAARNELHNPFLWEVARCSVAAPGFFQTKSLPGFGPFQDGGVRANNPLGIAVKESVAIWPSAQKHDLLVSVGTGYYPSVSEPYASPHNILHGRALPRLIRAIMSSPSIDGEQGFYEALNYIPDLMRLDKKLPSPLPRLDDVDALTELGEMSYDVPDELVRKILATAFFFFEMDRLPSKVHDSFYCQGSILCTRPYDSTLGERVLREFPGARFQAAHGHHLGQVDEDSGCRVCGYYRKEVAFTVTSLEEVTSIVIANAAFHHEIGGFPTSVQDLLKNQQAYAYFGRADHLIPSWPPRRVCYCFRGTKRRVKFIEPSLGRKKRRL